jgi:hypothetical protein
MIKPKYLKKIKSKVLHLTKEVRFQKTPNTTEYPSSFFAGKNPFPILETSPIEWWITKDGLNCCKNIANMAIDYDPQLQGGDKESFYKFVEKSLQENANNTKIFNVDKIYFKQVSNLFEARAVEDIEVFVLHLWSEIHEKLVKSITDWLILYPLHQVKSPSFILGFDGVSILSSNDIHRWQELSEHYSDANYWNPLSGTWIKEIKRDSFKDFLSVSTWLICEVSGTALGSRKVAARQMRTLIAVLFSNLENKVPHLLYKSGADKVSYSIQFPKDAAQVGYGCECADIGNLLPPLLVENINVQPETLSEVQKWYIERASSTDPVKQKITKASHYIHYGIVHDDRERFLNFFFALDALFGERNNVKESIINGVKQTFSMNISWEERAEKLFQLRSELVHGGVSEINDWEKLDSYQQYFKSQPLEDVKTAAMAALRTYIQLQNKTI